MTKKRLRGFFQASNMIRSGKWPYAARVFDYGRYTFLYPFEMTDGADLSRALSAVAEYAMREEIPLVFCDVPRDEVTPLLALGFKHINLDAETSDGESFRAEIKSECELIDEVPRVSDGEITLGEIYESDIQKYAEISRDESALKFWGYDYRADAPNADDEYFFNTARRELLAGVTLSLAVRLVPEFRGRGIGKRILPLVFDLSCGIGLSSLRCDVMNENKPSLAFVGREMELVDVQNGVSKYEIKLN